MTVPGVLVRLSEVTAPGDDGFDVWYQRKHLMEPLAIDGFRSARRYRVAGGEPTFMTVYECRSIDVLASAQAQATVANGSGGQQGRVRDTMQLACRQTWSAGQGMGGSAIVVQCKPMQGRESLARDFIRSGFEPERVPALVRMSLWEVDSTLSKAPGLHWVLSLESYDIARMALAVHERLLGCESDKTGLLVGSWTRYQLISAHDRAAPV